MMKPNATPMPGASITFDDQGRLVLKNWRFEHMENMHDCMALVVEYLQGVADKPLIERPPTWTVSCNLDFVTGDGATWVAPAKDVFVSYQVNENGSLTNPFRTIKRAAQTLTTDADQTPARPESSSQ